MPVFYHSHIVSDHLLNFSTSFTEEERDHLLRINASLFEATEIQERMTTQITLQHLHIKFCTVGLYISPQQIGLVPMYNHLSNAVSQVSIQQKPN